jgi:hypothetical protein
MYIRVRRQVVALVGSYAVPRAGMQNAWEAERDAKFGLVRRLSLEGRH